jgi:UbiD family decarboxylase
MIFHDLREFIAEVGKRNDVKVVEGADWNLEIGLITEWQISQPNNPLLLFKNIKGYSPEYSIATNLFGTPGRTALALGLSPDMKRLDIVRALRDMFSGGFRPIPPVEVEQAPVKENVLLGDKVDLFKLVQGMR